MFPRDRTVWSSGGVTYRMLLLLYFHDRAILERPLDDIGILRGALNPLALLKSSPKLGEVLELEEVPDVARVSVDYGGLANGRGGGDVAGHCVVRVVCCMVFFGWFGDSGIELCSVEWGCSGVFGRGD